MENIPTCENCDSPATVICNCSSNPTMLCEEHVQKHLQDFPDDAHIKEQLYIPLEPQEQEAFLSAQTLLFNAEKIKKESLIAEHSRKSEKILKDLTEKTNTILRHFKKTNQAYLSSLNDLTRNMAAVRAALAEVETMGLPTFRKEGFSVRLEALKKRKQTFAYPDIIKLTKTYCEELEQQGMSPLSQLIQIKNQSTAQLIEITDQLPFTEIRRHQIAADKISDIAFSSDGRYYAAGGNDNTVKVWNAKNGKLIHSLKGHTKTVYSVSFSPDSESLASGSADNTIRLWRVSSGEAIRQLQGHSDWVRSVAFSNNGELVASGSTDSIVKLWRVGGDLLASFKGHSEEVFSVCFSYDDRLLASGSEDNTIRIWNVSTCELRTTLSSHSDEVNSVCFARNSSFLISGSDDKTVKLWNVVSGELVHTFKGHNAWVNSVVFSPDDQFIASGGHDKTIKLWKVSTKSLVVTLRHHSSSVTGVNFSPDRLILASRDLHELKLVSLM